MCKATAKDQRKRDEECKGFHDCSIKRKCEVVLLKVLLIFELSVLLTDLNIQRIQQAYTQLVEPKITRVYLIETYEKLGYLLELNIFLHILNVLSV